MNDYRAIKNKNLIRQSFYESKLPPEVQKAFDELNIELQRFYKGQVERVIPFGSITGNWAVRKAINPDSRGYFDIDWGLEINADEATLKNLDDEIVDLDDFLEEVHFFVVGFLDYRYLIQDVDEMISGATFYFNRKKVDEYVENAQTWLDLYDQDNADYTDLIMPLILIFQSTDKDFIDLFVQKLNEKYGTEADKLIKRLAEIIIKIRILKPKHLLADPTKYRLLEASEKAKYDRFARRLNELKAANQKLN